MPAPTFIFDLADLPAALGGPATRKPSPVDRAVARLRRREGLAAACRAAARAAGPARLDRLGRGVPVPDAWPASTPIPEEAGLAALEAAGRDLTPAEDAVVSGAFRDAWAELAREPRKLLEDFL